VTSLLALLFALSACAPGAAHRPPAGRPEPIPGPPVVPPTAAQLLALFVRMRSELSRGPVRIELCTPSLHALATPALRADLARGPHWDATNQLLNVVDCTMLAARPAPYPTTIRVLDIAIAADSAFLLARSLPAWDGSTYQGSKGRWLTERLVLKEFGRPEYTYSVSDWDFSTNR